MVSMFDICSLHEWKIKGQRLSSCDREIHTLATALNGDSADHILAHKQAMLGTEWRVWKELT